MADRINARIKLLKSKGVIVVDPRQTYISSEVNLDRICGGCVLHPGTRLTGARTFVGSHAEIGTEGPATVNDSVIGGRAEIASGYLSGTTLLPGARAGANCHFRAGTLLEENVCTGHSVGLKHSILMYSVAAGSLINFCDALISGGRSRSEHSEIGSGFIHFNYTPWGKNGDKATPSLIGNVTEGVFLDQARIFVGGLSGMVGPNTVGFGATTVAGQVIRDTVDPMTLHSEFPFAINKIWSGQGRSLSTKHLENVRKRNVEYIAQLFALRRWYAEIRLRRSALQSNHELSNVLAGAMETLSACIHERIGKYNAFASEWARPGICENELNAGILGFDLRLDWAPELEHDQWMRSMCAEDREMLHGWLSGYANGMKEQMENQTHAQIDA